MRGKRIGIIGLGNMGGAIASGLISSGAVTKGNLLGFDKDPARSAAARRKYSIHILRSVSELMAHCGVVIFAVKPQDIDGVFKEALPYGRDRLYISIAAGVTTARIEKALGCPGERGPRVIRVMPNTPALVGEGISAICKGRYATAEDAKTAGEIFSSVGETLNLKERYFDLVTAISGSGPAYFFYFKEALIEAAVRLGMEKAAAKKLVAKTALGAARLLIESGHEPEILRLRVTSKGGTTERAIRIFEKAGIKKTVEKAIIAAANRSKELSGG